jgi:hypothetical protein
VLGDPLRMIALDLAVEHLDASVVSPGASS